MGVSARLFVRPEIGVDEIMVALKAIGREDVDFRSTSSPNYLQITFKSTVVKHKRSINFFYNTKDEYFGMNCNMLDLASDEESQEVLRRLGKMFGGVFQPSDCADGLTCELFQVPGAGDIRWTLERFFAKNEGQSYRSNEVVRRFAKFHEEKQWSNK